MDKVKPLKIETSIDGTQVDPFPVEANPTQDYLAAKGIAFENLDTYVIEKLGRVILEKSPNSSIKPTFLANGDVDYIEYFDGFTQTTPNRIAKTVVAYSGNNPATETTYIYDTDGTTILRTIARAYTFSGYELTKVEMSTT